MDQPVAANLALWLIGAVIGILGIAILGLIVIYNQLVTLQVLCKNAWSDIDVQLKRRHDLIPNLIDVVKEYVGYEKGTLEAVVAARSRAMSAGSVGEAAAAENMLSGTLKSLFALAENYPQLRGIEQFSGLQQSLAATEDAIQSARRYYNATARDLNTTVGMIPWNIVAGLGKFEPREFFQISDDAERAVPRVRIG
jgi:LemA protein